VGPTREVEVRAVATVLLILSMILPASAQTYVSGEISTNTTWDLAGSPYILEELTEVVNGSVLTIDPGVTVAFDGFYLFRATDGGSIFAEGTQDQRILFTSNADTPAKDDYIWIGVYSSPASSFAYCDFEYGRKGLDLDNSHPLIDHCEFRSIYTDGITCEDSSPTVTACDFHDLGSAFYIYAHHDVASPVVHGCNMYDFSNYGMYLTGFADPPLVTIDAEGNWWGTAVEGEIEQEIRHDVDDASIYGHVDFDPWLTDTPVEAASWGAIKAMYLE